MNLEFFVSADRLTYGGSGAPIAVSSGCDTFTIDFDPSWNDLVKVVILKNGKHSAQVIYTGKTPLPRQICGRGELQLCCCGYGQLGDDVAVLRTKPMVRPVRLLGAACPEAELAQPMAPDLPEQVMAAVGRAQKAAEQAEELRRELIGLKEAGAFRGEKGEPGQAATVAVEGIRHGEAPMVENLGTGRNALLRFTLPYKLTQAEKNEVLGDLEAVIDYILALQQELLGGAT